MLGRTTRKKNEEFKEFLRVKQRFLAKDKQDQLVFLADSHFTLQMTVQKYPSISFHLTSSTINNSFVFMKQEYYLS